MALRLISHRARAQIVRELSGLTPDQLVTVRRRWKPGSESYRGKTHRSYQRFFRSDTLSSHAALFCALYRSIGLNVTLRSLEGGERLCDAYEIYQAWEPEGVLKFDQAFLLAAGIRIC